MSIDMQFSFLSNDLASAKQSEAKVRSTEGGCGDKGFGDVFDEQLQQATEQAEGAEITQSILLTGQEVAAMLSDSLQGETVTLPNEEHQANNSPNSLAETAFNIDESAAQKNASLTADENASLLQLITKARDYAAELEAAPPQKNTSLQLTDAELASLAGQNQQAGTEHPVLLTDDQAVLPVEPLLGLAQGKNTKDGEPASEPGLAVSTGSKLQGLNDAEAVLPLTVSDEHSKVAGKINQDDKTVAGGTEPLRQLLPQVEAQVSAEQPAKAEPLHDKTAALQQALVADKTAGTLTVEAAPTQSPLAAKTADVAAERAGVTDINANTAALPTAQQSLQSSGSKEMLPVDLKQVFSASDMQQAESVQATTEQADLSAALLTPTLTAAATPGKNNPKTATQGFAEFQKAANAALAQQQKQQTEAQQQSGQQGAVQSEGAGPDLMMVQPGVVPHDQPQLASTLVATEKTLGVAGSGQAGSQSGGQPSNQSQHSFSQILATKQLDSQMQNQPALSLLEPTAANQLKERVMFQVNQKIQSADIRLAPEDLGSVQIKINLQQEQLSVQFVVQQSAAKEALEQQMPRLKELLQEQGMALTDGQVHQEQQSQQSQQDDRRTAAGRAGSRNTQDDDAEVAAQQVQIAVSDRMVDYYA